MCVIASARIPNPNEDPTLADKESILASLNIKAMQFDDTLGFGQRGGGGVSGVSPLGSPSLAAINKRGARSGTNVPMITELGEFGEPFRLT
jgi:potassium large conductance calcium-activated channel subfamily M alpha protein 1